MDNKLAQKAYMAMFRLLDNIYSRHPYGNLAIVLGDINPHIIEGSMSADPAAWEDFCECYHHAEDAYSTEFDTAYYASRQFLNMYDELWGYSIPYVMEEFTSAKYWEYYYNQNT